jgi:hypothetical protein
MDRRRTIIPRPPASWRTLFQKLSQEVQMPTPLQIRTMRDIQAGKVCMHNLGTAAFRIVGALPTVVGRLVNTLKLARWPKGAIGDQTCELTDDGRAALAAADSII